MCDEQERATSDDTEWHHRCPLCKRRFAQGKRSHPLNSGMKTCILIRMQSPHRSGTSTTVVPSRQTRTHLGGDLALRVYGPKPVALGVPIRVTRLVSGAGSVVSSVSMVLPFDSIAHQIQMTWLPHQVRLPRSHRIQRPRGAQPLQASLGRSTMLEAHESIRLPRPME